MTQDFSPPAKPVEWLAVHVSSGTQRRVWAQTAYFAAQAAGWTLSECTVEQVRK